MKSPIQQFISQTIEEIKLGVEGSEWQLHDEIEFEILVDVAEKSKGGFDLKVIGGSSETQGNTAQKVKFKIVNEKMRMKNSAAQIKGAGSLMKSMFQPLIELGNQQKKK